MNKLEITSLKGLKGLQGLSETEYRNWRDAQEQLGKISNNITFTQEDRVFRNQQFVNKFGLEAFNSYNAEQRDAIFKNALVSEVFDKTYNKDGVLSPELEDIKSADAKLYLIENNYIPQNQRDAEDKIAEENLNTLYKIQDTPSKWGALSMGSPTLGGSAITPFDRERAQIGADIHSKYNRRNDASVLEDAIVIENDSIKKESKPYKQFFDNQYITQLSYDPDAVNKIESDFNEIMDMKTEEGAAMFPYWDAYKDSYQLKDWTPEKKASTLAQFNAILAMGQGKSEEEQSYYQMKAFDIINKEFQHEIHDDTTLIDRLKNNTKAIATKTTSSLAQTLLGLYALGLEAQDMFDNGNRLQTYLSGKDEEGNDLNPLLTMQYYAHLDQYNTWSPEEQNLIFKRGGIGTSTNVRDVGEEYEWFTRESFGDAYSMLGYTAASIGLDYLTLGNGKILKEAGKGGARILKNMGMPIKDIATIHKVFSNPVIDVLGDAARMQIHSVSESVLEGMGVYEQVMADKRALFDKNYKDEIDKRVQDRLNFEGLSPNTLRVVTDAEGKMTGAVNDYQEREKEIRREVTQEVLNEYGADHQNAMEEAATRAFILEATTKQLKNSIGDNIFKQYMYAKPIKFNKRGKAFHMDDVELTEAGELVAKQLTKGDYVKKALKTIVGGGLDEYTDEMLNQGALAYGLNLANDYTNQVLNPEAVNYTSNWYSSLQSYLSGAEDALFDPSSLQQMFIGAISPIVTVSPNAIGATNYLVKSKDEKAKFRENLNTAEFINTFVSSPLFKEAIQSYTEYKNKEEDLQIINEVIKNHKADFESIIPSIKAITDYQNSLIKRDIEKQKDSENNMLFQLFRHLEDLSLTAEVSPLYNDYVEKMQNAANGNITNEDVQAFLNTDGNKDLISKLGQAQAEQVAKETIQKQATEFFDKQQEYDRISSLINDYYGDNYNNNIKDALKYAAFQEYDLTKRIESLEKSTSGRSKPSGELLGFRNKIYKSRINALIDAKIKDYNNLIEKIKEENTSSNPIKASINKKSIDRANKEIKNLQAEKEKNTSYNYKVLSAEEIISNTNPYERAMMFTHPQYYTSEQQSEIERAKNNLSSKNSDYFENIVDIAALSRRLEESEGILRTGLENINSLSAYIENLRRNRINAQKEVGTQALASSLYNELMTNKGDFKALATNINVFPLEVINKVIEEHPALSGVLKGYKEVAQYKKDSFDVIDTFEVDNNTKNILKQNMASILNRATDKQEALNAIEDSLDDSNITESNKNAINDIAQRLESIGYQRDATRLRNRAEEKRLKEEEEARKKIEEYNRDGNNFGWAGKKVGDTVYTLTKNNTNKGGYIVSFEKDDMGNGIMKVRWKTSKGKKEPLTLYNSAIDINSISNSPISEETSTKEEKAANTIDQVTPVGQLQDVDLGLSPQSPSTTSESVAAPSTVQTPASAPIVEVPLQDENPEKSANTSPREKSNLQGNIYYGYMPYADSTIKFQEKRKGKEEGDKLNTVINWLDEHNIQLQEIIDNELGLILRRFPKTELHIMRKKLVGIQQSDVVAKVPFLVIEYTPDIAKSDIHKEERGGLISFNNKQWLIVGTIGYNDKVSSTEAKTNVLNITDNTGKARSLYFEDHPDEMYWVDENSHTIITDFNAGNITTKLLNDAEMQIRNLGDLMYNADGSINEERNPFKYNWENIPFGIVIGGVLKPVRVPESLIKYVHSPKKGEAANGQVYVLLRGAGQDRLIPAAINPSMVEELVEDSDLKREIYENYYKLISKDFNTRREGLRRLWEIINIGTDKPDNVLIGNKEKAVLTFEKNGNKIATLDLTKPVDTAQFNEILSSFNPRINLTEATLSNAVELQKFSKAGALKTDIAKLGTSNASYMVAKIDQETGKPIIDIPIERKPAPTPIGSDISNKNPELISIPLGGTFYRLKDNKWYDSTWHPINDKTAEGQKLITSLYYNKMIKENDLSPLDLGNIKSEYNYYSISSNPDSPLVVGVNKKTNEVLVANSSRSKTILSKAAEITANKTREKAAIQALEDVDLGEESVPSTSTTPSTPQDVNTMVKEGMGAVETKPKASEPQPKQPQTAPTKKKKVNIENRANRKVKTLDKSGKNITFADVLKNSEFRKTLVELGAEKFGWTDDTTGTQMKESLKNANVPVDVIDDFNTWIDIIKNCR